MYMVLSRLVQEEKMTDDRPKPMASFMREKSANQKTDRGALAANEMVS